MTAAVGIRANSVPNVRRVWSRGNSVPNVRRVWSRGNSVPNVRRVWSRGKAGVPSAASPARARVKAIVTLPAVARSGVGSGAWDQTP